jgi:hypothetical protein
MHFVQVRPDEDEAGGDVSIIFKREQEQFGLIADLLKSVQLRGGFGEPDEALGPENRGGQRSQEALEGGAIHGRIQRHEKG